MSWQICQLKGLRQFDRNYIEMTTEKYRIDHMVLQQIPLSYFTNLHKWVKTIQLFQTKHWIKHRLERYINQLSRNGRYVEVYPQEYNWLMNLESFDLSSAQLVELGFNSQNQIC